MLIVSVQRSFAESNCTFNPMVASKMARHGNATDPLPGKARLIIIIFYAS
jgi:hypothetical protein